MLHEYSLGNILIFVIVVITALVTDLFSHREDRPVSLTNAAIWSIVWVSLALAFAVYIAKTHGSDKAYLFLSGYLLEESLSVDNLFVIMAVFSNFAIRDELQHRVLYYGILGAIILRFVFIAVGTSLLLLGEWVLGLFGILVIWSAWHMYQASRKGEHEIVDYTNHWSVRFARNFFRVYHHNVGHNFLTRQGGRLYVTPLFLCLFAVEAADIMFAFDSVPAVIAITQIPFLVYTSNIFAILGLRSMYFLLSAAKRYLCHLEKAVILILVFIGVKMILGIFNLVHISVNISLLVVLVSLAGGVVASIIFPKEVG